MKDYSEYFKTLRTQFKLGVDCKLKDSNLLVRFFNFKSFNYPQILKSNDNTIAENLQFEYPVVLPSQKNKFDSAIVLLHGLNERNWDKYLTWAETLCLNTGRPVILFPIAFHINRAPSAWSNPRQMQELINTRYSRNGQDKMLSFLNVALSERISENPYRFYSSGKQSANDIFELLKQIKTGVHPLFKADTKIDFFSYSIGAFLSQILFLSSNDLLSNSKLFMFCGGSIFSSMCGESRCIMDKDAFVKLYNYYIDDFENQTELSDNIYASFCKMIRPDKGEQDRLTFFGKMGKRLSGISLAKDTVIPYAGVEKAFGYNLAHERIQLLDFDYNYSHENPFPVSPTINQDLVANSFNRIFDRVSEFLAS